MRRATVSVPSTTVIGRTQRSTTCIFVRTALQSKTSERETHPSHHTSLGNRCTCQVDPGPAAGSRRAERYMGSAVCLHTRA